MYTKIVVPLDGSVLAERALPYAVRMANNFGADLVLLRVSEVMPLVSDTAERELEVIRVAEEYLLGVKNIITNSKLPVYMQPEQVHTLVAYGKSVREISEIAPFEKADLIVMATHGRTGLPRMVLGSTATSIVQHTKLPVVLIRPTDMEGGEMLEVVMSEALSLSFDSNAIHRVLLTLDGLPEAEAAIVPAIELAATMDASVYLLQVVAPFMPIEYGDLGAGYAYDTGAEEARRREEAYQYLDKIETQITAKGLRCVKVVKIGNPADEITDYAHKIQASTLVMATHARGKLGYLFMGSVAEEITRRTNLPVMLVHTFPKKHTSDKEQEVSAVTGG